MTSWQYRATSFVAMGRQTATCNLSNKVLHIQERHRQHHRLHGSFQDSNRHATFGGREMS